MPNAAEGRARLDSYNPPPEVQADPEKFAAWQRMWRRNMGRWVIVSLICAVPWSALVLLGFRWRAIPENVAVIGSFVLLVACVPLMLFARRKAQGDMDEFARTVLSAEPVPLPGYRGVMSYPGESSVDARVRAVEDDYRRRLTRLFVAFATAEAAVMVVLAVAIFALKVVDPEIGIWFLVAAAVVGGSILSFLLLAHMKARTAAVAQARGENPLF